MAVCAALLAIFHSDAGDAVSLWFARPTYGYCILIPFVSLYLIRVKWQSVEFVAIRPALSGVALFCLALAVWWGGLRGAVAELRQFAIVGMLEAAFVALFGWQMFNRLKFPLLYLFLMVPTGTFLLGTLQKLTVTLSMALLAIARLPVIAEGFVVHGKTGDYFVAPGCAGLNFLLSSLALSLVSGHLLFYRLSKKIAWLAICLLVALGANAVRVAGIVALAELSDHRLDILDDHLLYGWAFFLVVMLVTLAAGAVLQDEVFPLASVPEAAPVDHRTYSIAAIGLLILALAGAVSAQATSRLAALPSTITQPINPPAMSHGWIPTAADSRWQPNLSGADAVRHLSYFKGGRRVDLHLGYYASLREGHRPDDPAIVPGSSSQWRKVNGDHPLALGDGRDVQVVTLSNGVDRRLVWSWYWVGGQGPAIDGVVGRLKMFQARLSGQGDAAFIAISTENVDRSTSEQALMDFMTEAGAIERALDVMGRY